MGLVCVSWDSEQKLVKDHMLGLSWEGKATDETDEGRGLWCPQTFSYSCRLRGFLKNKKDISCYNQAWNLSLEIKKKGKEVPRSRNGSKNVRVREWRRRRERKGGGRSQCSNLESEQEIYFSFPNAEGSAEQLHGIPILWAQAHSERINICFL